MATERQIAANRANAQKSTGPRTDRGKSSSSRNNTRHGLYSTSPVIPGLESENAWEYHRVTTIQGLAPETALEEALAERVALVLWRLGRVARYEQTITTRARDQAPENLTTTFEALEIDVDRIRAQFSDSRQCLRAFDRFLQRLPEAPMSGRDASSVIHSVANRTPGFDKASFEVPGLFDAADHIEDIPGWTVARIRQVVDAIAESVGLESSVDVVQRGATEARTWHAQARAAYRQLNRRIQDARQECVLPESRRAEHVVRYETHLTRLLNQTLSQLRQVQRHREATRPRPAYNDYHLDVAPDLLPLSLARERGLGGEGFHFDESNPDSIDPPPSEAPRSDWHSAN